MARKFLYGVTAIIVLMLAGAIVLTVWSTELTRMALVPTTAFEQQPSLRANAYAEPTMWFERPGTGRSLARWQPAYNDSKGAGPVAPTRSQETPQEVPAYAVFFVHPTSYLDRSRWNAPLDDAAANTTARIYIRGMASPFGTAHEIWAPRYRQATIGAFLTDKPEAQRAIDAAYQDVALAFRYFLQQADPDVPIVLAGHSQGALHLLTLLREEVSRPQIARRVAAIYAIGWPISVEHDLPALTFPQCTRVDQSACIASWSSFAEPADPSDLMETYGASIGFDGVARGDGRIVCTNPLTGSANGAALAAHNRGTLVPNDTNTSGHLVAGAVPARCDPRGLLLIGDPPEMGSAVLPGNNYHVYDIPLFWANLKGDVSRRVRHWHNR